MAKAKNLTSKQFFSISGTDPKNGIVTLKKFGKGYILSNSRTGAVLKIADQTKAIENYNHQINTSH